MRIILFILSLALFGSASAQAPSFLWAKAAGGTNYDDANSVATDANGNVYVTGYFQSPTITFGTTTLTNAGGFDIFIVKYDANGNALWAKSAGGVNDDVGNSITTDANGDVLVTGYFYSPSVTFGSATLNNTSPNSNDIFVLKYDPSGNVLWAKSEGGTYYDYGKSVSTDANGNVLVTGNFSSSTISFGSHQLTNTSMFGWDVFVVKYDASGNALWAKGGIGSGGEYASGVSTDATGNVFISGYFYGPSITFGSTTLPNSGSPNMDSDIFVVKYDASGNVLWAKGEGGTDNDVANSIATDANGNVFLAGYFKGPSFTFGTTTLPNAGVGTHDVFVSKYDANGNALWAKAAVGTGGEFAKSLSTDASGNVFVTGSFYSPSLSFGTATLTNANSSANSSDIFVVKLDNAGNVLWEKSEGGTDNDVGFGVTVNTNGDVFVTGHFHSTSVTFGTTTLTNTGGSTFVAKLGDVNTSIGNASAPSRIRVFPNPASLATTLQSDENLDNASLIVYNAFGQIVQEVNSISGRTVTLSLEKLANGPYFIHLREENKTSVCRIVVLHWAAVF